MGNKWGFHSGVGHMKDCKVGGDLYVQDDIVFSDVSAGVLGITGGIDMSGTTSAIGINMTAGTFSTTAIQIGSSASQNTITSGQTAIDINTTTADTSGTQVSMNVKQIQTADTRANQTEVFVAEFETDYESGDWSNAIVGRIDYQTTGDAAGGMAAPICSELNYPGKACAGVGGAYYVLDLEMNCPTNFTVGTNLSYPNAWINFGLWGNATAMADWETQGFLFRTDGFKALAGSIISAGAHTLRVRVEDSAGAAASRYLVMSTAENCLTLGACTVGVNLTGAMTDGIIISGACSDNGIEISGACTGSAIEIVTGAFGIGLNVNADGTTGIAVANTFSGTTMLALAGTGTDGINISGICGDAIEISAAATANGINISADCVTGITIVSQTTMGIALAVAAAVGGIAIDAGTVNHAADGAIVDINLDIEGQYSVNAINVNLDFETTGMAGTDVTTAFKADINELLVHTNGAGLYGTSVTLTGFATGTCDLIGHLVTLDGSKTAGDTSSGLKVISTQTINHSGEDLYGSWIDFSGMTLTDGNVYGAYLDMSFTNGSTAYGIYVNNNTDTTAGIHIAGGGVTGISMTGAFTGITCSVTNTALTVGDAVSGIRSIVTAPAASNAYGMSGYFDATITGTTAGHCYGLGSWINTATTPVLSADHIIVPLECGVYTGEAQATARIVLAQFQAILNGAPASLHVFRINTSQTTTAVFAAANAGSIGFAAGAGTTSTKNGDIPIADVVGTGVVYVRTYDAAG